MSYEVKKLAHHLGALLSNVVDDLAGIDQTKPLRILGGAGSHIEIRPVAGQAFSLRPPDDAGPTLYILEEGLRAEQLFVHECLKDRDFALQIGGDAIRARLHELIKSNHSVAAQDLNLERIAKEDILKFLRAEVRNWHVRVPIVNLTLQSSPVTVGAVTFVNHADGVIANVKLLMSHEGPADRPEDAGGKATMLQVLGEIAQQGSVWAEVDIQSHQSRIKEVAEEWIEAAINAVRAFTRLFTNPAAKAAFGLPYELANNNTGIVAETTSQFVFQFDRRGFYAPVELTDFILDHLRAECCLDRISNISGKAWRDLNSLERVIRVACHWLGRAAIAPTLADSFTHCAIAIERLLIVDNEETTVERFADRLAYLLADGGEQRKAIHKEAKRLYDIRSRIVHAGFQSIEEEAFRAIECLAVESLIKTAELAAQIADHESLRAMLHDRKMGVSNSSGTPA